MTWSHPWALALFLAIPMLWVLHRRRAPRVVRVASVVPFRAPEGAPPPSAARRGVDPVLALLIASAAALALGAAGPSVGSDAARVRVVVDPSASMSALLEEPQTGDVADSARAHAEMLIAAAAPGAAVEQGNAASDPDAALAAARADGFPGVVFVTDHAPPSVPPGVVVVGPSAPARWNVALADIALDGDTAVVGVRNFGGAARRVTVRVQGLRETGTASVDVAPRSRASVRLPAPRRRGESSTIESSTFEIVSERADALAADDRLEVLRRGGARRVRVAGTSPHVAAALRALGMTTTDATEPDANVGIGGPLVRDLLPNVELAPAAGTGTGVIRAVAGSATVDASTLVRRGATPFPLPAPSARLAATCRLQGGETLVEDGEGALVVRDGTTVVIALDPESAASDWARDGSFVAALGAALDLVTDGPDRLVTAGQFAHAESDVAQELLPEPARDELERIVRRDFGGTDLAAACCVAGAVAAALAAWLSRRR